MLDSVVERAAAGGLGARSIEIDVLRALVLQHLGRMAPAMLALTVVRAHAALDRRHFGIGPLPMGLTAGNKADVRITLALTARR